MSEINDGGPAFPSVGTYSTGMSLLDWFAGQALVSAQINMSELKQLAEDCYEIADAMLKEKQAREKEQA